MDRLEDFPKWTDFLGGVKKFEKEVARDLIAIKLASIQNPAAADDYRFYNRLSLLPYPFLTIGQNIANDIDGGIEEKCPFLIRK